MRIAIITPVRDEEQYIGTTVACMLAQTVPPVKWIIVDDGSTDRTGAILADQTAGTPWVEVIAKPDRGHRHPGGGVIESFYAGLERLRPDDYDVVAKFDGDLRFGPETLATIGRKFSDDPRLGITGGTRYEQVLNRGPFKKLAVPAGYVSGIDKFYRKECFADIGGLIRRAGWDGVDTVRANMAGWRTGQIDTLPIHHLKTTGTARGEGVKRAGLKYGNIGYFVGGYLWHFGLHVIRLTLFNRSPQLGLYMARGYWRAWRNRDQRESPEFRATLKQRERQNLRRWLRLSTRKDPLHL